MDDKTAIHQAVADSNYQEVRQLLRANRLLANAVGKQEATPLHKATNLEIVELLVSFGAKVNAPGWMGDTPLHEAVHKDRFEIAQFLIAHGANVRAVREYNITPLHWAKNARMARLLVENGAVVSIKNDFGNTPIFSAVEVGDLEFLNLLVENGAEIDIKDTVYGRTPLHITSNLAIMRRLLDLGANANTPDRTGQTPVHKAAVRGE